jgi:hypothetical protein
MLDLPTLLLVTNDRRRSGKLVREVTPRWRVVSVGTVEEARDLLETSPDGFAVWVLDGDALGPRTLALLMWFERTFDRAPPSQVSIWFAEAVPPGLRYMELPRRVFATHRLPELASWLDLAARPPARRRSTPSDAALLALAACGSRATDLAS